MKHIVRLDWNTRAQGRDGIVKLLSRLESNRHHYMILRYFELLARRDVPLHYNPDTARDIAKFIRAEIAWHKDQIAALDRRHGNAVGRLSKKRSVS